MKSFKNRAPGFLSSPTESLAPTEGCIWWWERVRESTCAPVPFPVPCCACGRRAPDRVPECRRSGRNRVRRWSRLLLPHVRLSFLRKQAHLSSCDSDPSPLPTAACDLPSGHHSPCVTWADPPFPIRLPSQGPICVLSALPLKSQERGADPSPHP